MNELSLKYASALYELALEDNQIDNYQEQCKQILSLLDENEDFLEVLDSAFMSVEEKHKVLEDTLKNVSTDIVSLLKIIVANHRVNLMKDVLNSFNSLVNQRKGIVEGLLYTAFLLENKEIQAIEEALSKKEKRQVSLNLKVDPSLIGGIKIVINNRVYDETIKNKIAEMKRNLINKEENSL